MRRMMIKTLCLVVGLLVALTLQAGAGQSQKTTLVVALNQDPDILDPSLSRTYVGRIIYEHMCEKLYEIDENLKIYPQLAAEMPTFTDGGKTVTIKLRRGVKFNDGTPMNAEAVRYSLDRHLNMKGSSRRSELELVESIEAVDPLTVRLRLKAPFSPLVATLADRAGMTVSPTRPRSWTRNLARSLSAWAPGLSPSGCPRIESSWSSPSTTSTQARRSSSGSYFASSQMTTCGWPTCARATST